jgi:site-specific DNA recombinase
MRERLQRPLTRSLADFAKLVELFDAHGVSFVSVTQHFNTTTSMGRLTPVKAAVEGRLPRGIGVERLRDAPAEWSRQFETLGLNPQ